MYNLSKRDRLVQNIIATSNVLFSECMKVTKSEVDLSAESLLPETTL